MYIFINLDYPPGNVVGNSFDFEDVQIPVPQNSPQNVVTSVQREEKTDQIKEVITKVAKVLMTTKSSTTCTQTPTETRRTVQPKQTQVKQDISYEVKSINIKPVSSSARRNPNLLFLLFLGNKF